MLVFKIIFIYFLLFVCFRKMTIASNCFKSTMIFFLVCLNILQVFGQSNYASHGNNINYIGNGLPEETVLDGKVSDIELLKSASFFAWRGCNYCYFSEDSFERFLFLARTNFSCQLSIGALISR